MKFEDYSIAREIKLGLQDLGYKRPTDIQYKAIPSILNKEDVLAIAQTGTGKTAAFAIPLIDTLHKKKQAGHSEGIRCVVLAPTHELALQIAGVFEQIAKHTGVKTLALIGGVEQDPQIEALQAGIDVLVATPGRLFDLKSQGYVHLNRVEILVLDEADHMLDLGFLKDIQDLGRSLPRNRQTLFFSATINPRIKKVAYSLVRNAIRIQISPKDPVAKNIDHSVAFIEMDDKRFFLERLVKENPDSKFMAFVRTIVRAERVAGAMERVGIQCESIHRNKEEKQRSSIIKNYKAGSFKLLITTDISARGIDIPDIDFVINYDLPEVAEVYVHRVGRTGRGKKRGTALSFCSPQERETLEEIERFLQAPVEVLDIEAQAYTETLQLAHEKKHDWRALMEEAEKENPPSKTSSTKSKKKKSGKRKKK